MPVKSLIYERLPSVPEDVTRDWLSKVLGLPLTYAEITDAIHGTASKLFFTLTYDKTEPSTAADRPTFVCVKGGMNPHLPVSIRQLLSSIFAEKLCPITKPHLGSL